MTDDSFLQAIIAEPEGGLPRLAFADWSEENGPAARTSVASFRSYAVG